MPGRRLSGSRLGRVVLSLGGICRRSSTFACFARLTNRVRELRETLLPLLG